MSMAVASAAAPLPPTHIDRDLSPKTYPLLAPSTTPASAERSTIMTAVTPPGGPVASLDRSAQKSTPDGKSSPNPNGVGPPKIIVKKEPPSSPSMPANSRHRPRKLDLSTNIANSPLQGAMSSRPSAGPLTAREGGLVMQEVGLACLSPGFQTHDPTMREQLQRSISVRDQQRSIIESRLQKTAKGDGDGQKTADGNMSGNLKTPSTSRKRPPPPGLSIVPPSAEQFANERVVQSAPLNQTFTGRHQPHPMTRHVANQTSTLSSTSHIHHVPATQTNNRLPPIADVFGSDTLGTNRERDANNRNGYYQPNSASASSHSNNLPPFPSPGLPPNQTSQPQNTRPREYRSAEEAVHELAGGREELLPRIVHHYGKTGPHQPPTPPSPSAGAGLTPNKNTHHLNAEVNGSQAPTSGRRRTRVEYERDNGSPPLGSGPEIRPRGPFRDEGSDRRKKEEFLSLCARAWDLFHS